MLQQSHYVFGNSQVPLNTTNRREFTQKKAYTTRGTKDLTKTNFILGDDKLAIKSVNEGTFVRHPL